MSAVDISAGRELRVLIQDNSGAFLPFIGLQAKTLALSAKIADITHPQSPGGWQELLPGAGVKSMTLTGEGIFTNSTSSDLARSVFFTQALRVYRFVIPEFGTLEGAFLMSGLTYRGAEQGLATYAMTLTSAGEPAFTPNI